jgi:short-subunit dehydrogenase
MRGELWGSGVGVILVEPGPIASAFRDTAAARARASLDLHQGRFAGLYLRQIRKRERGTARPEPFTKPPEAVAERIRHALESRSPRRRYPVTIPAHLGAWAVRLLPAWLIDAAIRTRR